MYGRKWRNRPNKKSMYATSLFHSHASCHLQISAHIQFAPNERCAFHLCSEHKSKLIHTHKVSKFLIGACVWDRIYNVLLLNYPFYSHLQHLHSIPIRQIDRSVTYVNVIQWQRDFWQPCPMCAKSCSTFNLVVADFHWWANRHILPINFIKHFLPQVQTKKKKKLRNFI